MDETQKTAFFPTPVRWFKVPMDGMKRGFAHLKKRVDQMIRFDQIRPSPTDTETESIGQVESSEGDTASRPKPSVGVHLNTYA